MLSKLQFTHLFQSQSVPPFPRDELLHFIHVHASLLYSLEADRGRRSGDTNRERLRLPSECTETSRGLGAQITISDISDWKLVVIWISSAVVCLRMNNSL
ncbi:hypothetical protein CEXT_45351 [Caerostris extrusa]|uniref:Uncharacterized protein n=1 Tax=Caerostris extrusa TaxID=172846 RepID=A0AAV4VNA5_CAEEX|nr:hypothetical protein CEXT_45351 [Caerostris extrusa]